MKSLLYTAMTTSGRAFDIEFPLHIQTRSEGGVSQTVTDLLAALSATLAERSDLSEGDVLQALTMTLAIRARIMDENAGAIDELVYELLNTALNAARDSQSYFASLA